MNDFTRLAAINGLAKTAEARTLVRPNVSAAYMLGFTKAAEAAGVDPDKLIKLAWTWGGVIRSPLAALSGGIGAIGNSLYSGFTGNGFGQGLKDGWNYGYDFGDALQSELVSKETGENLLSGTKSMLNGIMSGAMAVPGIVTGAVGALGKGTAGLVSGNGFKGFGEGWDAGQRLADEIGIGDYDLGHAKRRVGIWQNNNMNEYMSRNGIDPSKELSWLERQSLNGMGIANAAGEALGEIAAFGAGGKAAKLTSKIKLPKMAKKPATPAPAAPAVPAAPATAQAASTTSRAAAQGAATGTPGTAAAGAPKPPTSGFARTMQTAKNTAKATAGRAKNTLSNLGKAYVGKMTVDDGIGHRVTTVDSLRDMYGRSSGAKKYGPGMYSLNNLSSKVVY